MHGAFIRKHKSCFMTVKLRSHQHRNMFRTKMLKWNTFLLIMFNIALFTKVCISNTLHVWFYIIYEVSRNMHEISVTTILDRKMEKGLLLHSFCNLITLQLSTSEVRSLAALSKSSREHLCYLRYKILHLQQAKHFTAHV